MDQKICRICGGIGDPAYIDQGQCCALHREEQAAEELLIDKLKEEKAALGTALERLELAARQMVTRLNLEKEEIGNGYGGYIGAALHPELAAACRGARDTLDRVLKEE